MFKTCWNLIVLVFIAIMLALSQIAGAAVKYVKEGATGNGSSWTNAFGAVQDGINASGATEVWVATGTYYPTIALDGGDSRTKTIKLKPAVKVLGGFAGSGTNPDQRDPFTNITILSGDIGTANDASDNSYHVVYAESTGTGDDTEIRNDVWLDGFRITNGNANGTGSLKNFGGGLLVKYGSPTILRCAFIGNLGANGAGAHVEGNPGVEGVPATPEATFISCSFLGNGNNDTTVAGGLCNRYDRSTLICCVFSGNKAVTAGGGINNQGIGSILKVFNSTFSKNQVTDSTSGQGGAIANFREMYVRNSIVWGNTGTTGAQIYDSGAATVDVTYSDVQGGYTGTGNFGGSATQDNPQFIDDDGADNTAGTLDDNVQLNTNSPCVNSGLNSDLPADNPWDLDGDSNTTEKVPFDRLYQTRELPLAVDRGAHEVQVSWRSCCPEDITGPGGVPNCVVNVDDLLAVINDWGFHGGRADCHANFGIVNVDDLLAVINAWGLCDTTCCAGGQGEETSMPSTVNECMEMCDEEWPNQQFGYSACVTWCVDWLCEHDYIECDD